MALTPRIKLKPQVVSRIREVAADLRVQGRKVTSRAVAPLVPCAEGTARKYLRAIEDELRVMQENPVVLTSESGGGNSLTKQQRLVRRDLVSVMEESADNFAATVLTVSRRMAEAARTGQELDVSVVQLATAAGITLDKLTLMKREEQSQVFQRVLKEDAPEVLDAMIEQLDAEIARMESSPMVTR